MLAFLDELSQERGVRDGLGTIFTGRGLGRTGKEGWEMCIADNEVSGLLQRFPNVFSE